MTGPLNDGISEVILLEHLGDDKSIVNAARVSFANDDYNAPFDMKKDAKLVKYLIEHNHSSPMEHNIIKFKITAPIFVSNHFLRHRIGVSYNFESGRYVEIKENKFYIPQEMRVQAKSNRQASSPLTDDNIPAGFPSGALWTASCQEDFRRAWTYAYNTYERLLEKGVAREQARGVLPIGQYNSFYTSLNLRSLLHFSALRMHEGAQYETQQFARAMFKAAEQIFPVATSVFKDMHPDIFGANEKSYFETLR